MNERRKITRAIADRIEPLLNELGADGVTIQGAIEDAADNVMNELDFEDED